MVYAFYMMSNKPGGMIYCGATGQLVRRSFQQKGSLVGGALFCKKYGVDRLVYFELFESKEEALRREWIVKRWRREWKIDLILGMNREWLDLGPKLIETLPFEMMERD